MEVQTSGGPQIEVHCPTEAELQAEPQVNVPCTVDGCNKTFSTSAARNIHIIQTHKIYKDDDERMRFNRYHQKNLAKVTKQFYCPVSQCNRSIGWEKPFSRLSLLKQHYYILHAEKKYECQRCDKRFSTQRQQTTHQRDCGKEFFCTCGEKHNSVAALYMHAKRKQHALPDEFAPKRRKREQVKEKYVLVVPVPVSMGNPQDIEKMIREPVPILPHSRTCTYIPVSGALPCIIGNNPQSITTIPATITTPDNNGNSVASGSANLMKASQCSATTSTQTDEAGVNRLPPKLDTNSAYAQTAHSCFPSFIPMVNGPRTFKRHKKTLAIQTHTDWPQGHAAGQMSTSETQTLVGQDSTAQTQTMLDSQPGMSGCPPPLQPPVPGSLFPQFSGSVPFNEQQASPSCAIIDSRSSSATYSYSVNSTQIPTGSGPMPQNCQFDTNSTQTHWSGEPVGLSQSAPVTTTLMDARKNLLPPNEVLTQTDLTFQNFMEYNTSETQTFTNVTDAMTDTSEPGAVPLEPSTSAGIVPDSLGHNVQGTTGMGSTPASDIEMTGLDLLFLASTEHRASSSLEMQQIDDSSCCQQTQTGFDTDTGHQETQTVWDWSLDEFSFLDQYTQTALSASSSASSTTSIPESDQFCQTGLGLYSQFAFSNTETQTVSVFDLEMFGNSISVQTESGSGSTLLAGQDLNDAHKQVQVASLSSQQEMVCTDVQTDALDFNRLRSRQMGSGQLASSQTQTSFWEDIESMIRSDNFTQTQFP